MYSKREGRADGKGAEDFDRTVLQVLQLQSAPKVDIDVFSGEILEYQYFVETFREVVERVIPDERGRLTRLNQLREKLKSSSNIVFMATETVVIRMRCHC